MAAHYNYIDAKLTGARIRRCRKEILGASQERFGDLLGISRNAVGMWERGEIMPSLDMAMKLADLLGMPVNAFVIKKREEGKK